MKSAPSAPGLFVMSIDVELAWGGIHHGEPPQARRHAGERRSVAALLDLMERYEMAATWAVVGHLFLDECSPADEIPHAEVRRAPYPWFDGDWFQGDPGTSLDQDPLWYGGDLVESIQACLVPQEIGSHSFSHQIIGDPACDAAVFRSELIASRRVAADAGVELRSFVYPRNSIGHREVLVEEGFAAYRGPTPQRFPRRPVIQRRLLSILDTLVPMAGTVVLPSLDGQLCNVPQTYLFDPTAATARRLGPRLWAAVIGRRLRQAARHGSLFHLWFHSHDIAKAPDRAGKALEALFQVVARERGAGRLLNLTMGEVAERMNQAPVEK